MSDLLYRPTHKFNEADMPEWFKAFRGGETEDATFEELNSKVQPFGVPVMDEETNLPQWFLELRETGK